MKFGVNRCLDVCLCLIKVDLRVAASADAFMDQTRQQVVSLDCICQFITKFGKSLSSFALYKFSPVLSLSMYLSLCVSLSLCSSSQPYIIAE